jgi:UDP-glucose 4-epimerase
MKKNVIVTGGAGFIGSNLCKILAQRNFNPITVDNLSTGFRKLVKFGDLIESDCGDYEKMMEVFSKYKPLAIFHIAGSKSVEESVRNPHKYYDNNVTKMNSLLLAAANSDIEHFIFSSSAAIFSPSESVNENDAKKPSNTYGFSKLMGEQLLESYKESHKINYSALRYFNVTGADPELEVGEITKNPANIFPILAEAASKKREEFVIFGNDYQTKDGTCIRDYIHVHDLVNAHVMALEKQIEKNESAKINLGNGVGFSVKETAELFQKITGENFRISCGPRRIGDPDVITCDNKLAKKYLGWEPKFTKLEDHISHSWQWYQKSQNFS